jgi:hypothetical protein
MTTERNERLASLIEEARQQLKDLTDNCCYAIPEAPPEGWPCFGCARALQANEYLRKASLIVAEEPDAALASAKPLIGGE